MGKRLIVVAMAVFIVIGMCFILNLDSATAQTAQSNYVGVEKCKSCHAKEYDDFAKRKFDKAWRILEMREEDNNPECLKCHTTGYGEPTGFVNAQATPHLKFKQCEACHGPGSLHAANPSDTQAREAMKKHVSEKNVCIKCHMCMNTHSGQSF